MKLVCLDNIGKKVVLDIENERLRMNRKVTMTSPCPMFTPNSCYSAQESAQRSALKDSDQQSELKESDRRSALRECLPTPLYSSY